MREAISCDVFEGLDEACLDSLAYDSLVPMSQLQTYARLMEQYRSVVLYGCVGMGKTRLCRQLAHFVQVRVVCAHVMCYVTSPCCGVLFCIVGFRSAAWSRH